MDLHIVGNAELLISAVQSRPTIWDKSLTDHKDRIKVRTAWREVCCELHPDFEQMSDAEKTSFGALVLKRWTNIRDSYRKQRKTSRKKMTGSKTGTSTKYIFFEQLRFLDKVFEESLTEDTLPPSDVRETDSNKEAVPGPRSTLTPTNPNKKRKRLGEIDRAITPALKENENAHLSFFKGLLPSIADLTPDETLEMQIGVLKVIRGIKSRRQKPGPSTQPTEASYSHCPTNPPRQQPLYFDHRPSYHRISPGGSQTSLSPATSHSSLEIASPELSDCDCIN